MTPGPLQLLRGTESMDPSRPVSAVTGGTLGGPGEGSDNSTQSPPGAGALGGDRGSSELRSEGGLVNCACDTTEEGVETGRRPPESPGLSSLTRGAQVVFDHVNGHPATTRQIATAAGFITSATARHLSELAAVGLVRQEARRWERV